MAAKSEPAQSAPSKEVGGEAALVMGSIGLIASIVANIAQSHTNDSLRQNLEAAQQMIADWQRAYQQLDVQVVLAQSMNEELARQNRSLREELPRVRAQLYAAQQRAVEAETARSVAESALEKLKKAATDRGGKG